MKERIVIGAVITVVIGFVAFCITDIAMGEAMSLECAVTGRYYVPQETTFSIDEDGMVSIDTDPEEFHVTVREVYGEHSFDISTLKSWYSNLTNGQVVRVGARLGRWTRAVHVKGIEE